MCRLYCMRSNYPRKVECELIGAQNALIVQSLQDERGMSNPDGWGLASYRNGEPCVDRQIEPAYADEAFRWAAASVHACDVMAHVRRGTVGGLRLENTHPFVHGSWMLAHNGTVGAFEAIRGRLLETMAPAPRAAIRGDTDSEHLFQFLLSLREREAGAPLVEVVGLGLHRISDWSREEDPDPELALSVLWTDGRELVGSRLNRSLWYVERGSVHPCEVCKGELHVEGDPGSAYQAVVVASEPITTTEEWSEVPDGALFTVGREAGLKVHS